MSQDMNQSMLERIAELEALTQNLEERQRLMLQLVDEKRSPLIYFQLYYDLSDAEITAMLDIMDEARASIEKGNPIGARAIEERLLELFARLNKNYQFVKVIFHAVADSGQYPDLYDHYRKDLNLGPARQEE